MHCQYIFYDFKLTFIIGWAEIPVKNLISYCIPF